MKAVVLAGGFAKRMWPLTKDKPKHLLPVGGRPMLDYVIDKLEPLSRWKRIFLSTNAKFEEDFKKYLHMIHSTKRISLFVVDRIFTPER